MPGCAALVLAGAGVGFLLAHSVPGWAIQGWSLAGMGHRASGAPVTSGAVCLPSTLELLLKKCLIFI